MISNTAVSSGRLFGLRRLFSMDIYAPQLLPHEAKIRAPFFMLSCQLRVRLPRSQAQPDRNSLSENLHIGSKSSITWGNFMAMKTSGENKAQVFHS